MEMRMIRWICGHTRLDKISDEVIRGKLRVASTKDKIRDARLRWFQHTRRSTDALVRRCEKLIAWSEKELEQSCSTRFEDFRISGGHGL